MSDDYINDEPNVYPKDVYRDDRPTRTQKVPSGNISFGTTTLTPGVPQRLIGRAENGVGSRVTLVRTLLVGSEAVVYLMRSAEDYSTVASGSGAILNVPYGYALGATPVVFDTIHPIWAVLVSATPADVAAVSVAIEQYYGD